MNNHLNKIREVHRLEECPCVLWLTLTKEKNLLKGRSTEWLIILKPYQNSSCGIQEMRGVNLVSGLHNLYIEY